MEVKIPHTGTKRATRVSLLGKNCKSRVKYNSLLPLTFAMTLQLIAKRENLAKVTLQPDGHFANLCKPLCEHLNAYLSVS